MSHFEGAGYRILSFKYNPAAIKSAEPVLEGGGHETKARLGKPVNKELPSLSSLQSCLQEIETECRVEEDRKPALTAPQPEAHSALPTPVTTTQTPTSQFHHFEDLPTEIRIKIWNLTFLPRAVELRPTRPNYSSTNNDNHQQQWQSGCTSPAALSVCSEARELALAHYTIAFPLVQMVIPARQHQPATTPWSFQTARNQADSSSTDDSTSTDHVKSRFFQRMLYISPIADTVCLLGQDSDPARLSGLLSALREADTSSPTRGIRRLGLSVRGWGYGGSAVLMRRLGETALQDLDQLVLFMYGEQHPPPEWKQRGATAARSGGEQDEKADEEKAVTERFRIEGNALDLVPCEGGRAWHAYKMWSGGKGRQFWDEDGNIMRIGRNEIKVMDLEFRKGW